MEKIVINTEYSMNDYLNDSNQIIKKQQKLMLGQSDGTESMEVWIHNIYPQQGLNKRTSEFSTDNTRAGALKNTIFSYSE